MSNIDKYKEDVSRLIALGEKMELDLTFRYLVDQGELSEKNKETAKKIKGCFEADYQRWYTESCVAIKQLIPVRSAEFEYLYKGVGRRKDDNICMYSIQDWLNGIRSGTNGFGEKLFNDVAGVSMRFKTQLAILKSFESRFESTLFEIRLSVQADMFNSELDAARELLKHGLLRASGTIAGVIIEKHLSQVSANHNIITRKKNQSITGYNDLLKIRGFLDTPSWLQIQRLGNIRNLCVHDKKREPTKEEVEELISGVEKFTKTLF
jgi:hypothetical protein